MAEEVNKVNENTVEEQETTNQENIPVEEGTNQGELVDPEVQAQLMRQREQELYNAIISVTAARILDGKIDCLMPRENLPKNTDPLVMDDNAASWSVSIMVAIMDILKEEEIFNDSYACTVIEEFMKLYNRRFLTWRMWKNSVEHFIEKTVLNPKLKKKSSVYNRTDINWDNLINWIRFSLVNTYSIRAEIINKYFQQPEGEQQ